MKAEEIKNLFDSFESIAIEYEGVECWSAREPVSYTHLTLPTILLV